MMPWPPVVMPWPASVVPTPHAPLGDAQIVVQAGRAEPRFIDECGPKCLRVADDEELIQSTGSRVKGSALWIGDRCSAEAGGIRIVEIIFVVEIVEGKVSRFVGVPVDPPGRLFIVDRQPFARRLETIRSNIGGWDVLEQLCRRNGECPLRYHSPRKDARVLRTTGRVERFVLGDLVSEFLGESPSLEVTVDDAGQRIWIGWGD